MISNPTFITVELEEDQKVKDITYQYLKTIGYEYQRPTQSLAHRYLRREFNLNIEVSADREVYDSFYYAVSVLGGGYVTSVMDMSNTFKSYEEAYEAGIVKAIEHVLKKELPGNHSR